MLSLLAVSAAAAGCVQEDDVVQPRRRRFTPTDAATIGPEGGSLSLPDGAGIVVPPGALETTVELVLQDLDDVLPGDVAVLSDTYRLSPGWIAVAQPLQVSLPVAGEAGPNTRLWFGREGAGTWQQLPVSVEDGVATGTVPGGGLLVVSASPSTVALRCGVVVNVSLPCGEGQVGIRDRCVPAALPPAGEGWTVTCDPRDPALACDTSEIDVVCDDDHLGIACVCRDGNEGRGESVVDPALGACGASDPCRVGCTTVQVGATCVEARPVTVDLGSLVPAAILAEGGTVTTEDGTFTLDVATCQLEMTGADACGATARLDLLARTCAWQDGHVTDDVCDTLCDAACRVY